MAKSRPEEEITPTCWPPGASRHFLCDWHKTEASALQAPAGIPPQTPPKCSAVRIKTKFRAPAFRVGLGFAAALLRRRLKRPQTPHFIEDALRIKLALQPLECSIHRLTFSNNNFWHQFTSILGNFSPRAGGLEEI
jgi:hypothetical protein